MTSIYVIGVERSPVKVGRARNVAQRLTNLQIGNPNLLRLFHSIDLPRHFLSAKIELAVHNRLGQYHRRGEWFDVDADVAAKCIDDVIWEYGHDTRADFAARIPLTDPSVISVLRAYNDKRRAGARHTQEIDDLIGSVGGKNYVRALQSAADGLVQFGGAHFIDAPAYMKGNIKGATRLLVELYGGELLAA